MQRAAPACDDRCCGTRCVTMRSSGTIHTRWRLQASGRQVTMARHSAGLPTSQACQMRSDRPVSGARSTRIIWPSVSSTRPYHSQRRESMFAQPCNIPIGVEETHARALDSGGDRCWVGWPRRRAGTIRSETRPLRSHVSRTSPPTKTDCRRRRATISQVIGGGDAASPPPRPRVALGCRAHFPEGLGGLAGAYKYSREWPA